MATMGSRFKVLTQVLIHGSADAGNIRNPKAVFCVTAGKVQVQAIGNLLLERMLKSSLHDLPFLPGIRYFKAILYKEIRSLMKPVMAPVPGRNT